MDDGETPSSYQELVGDLRAEGRLESPGEFSLESGRRQSQLLASTPPESVWAAGALLRQALFLAGEQPYSEGSYHNCVDSGQTAFTRAVLIKATPCSGRITSERILAGFEKPFESIDPIDLCLTRGLLWFTGRGFRLVWDIPEKERIMELRLGPGSQVKSRETRSFLGGPKLRLEVTKPEKQLFEVDDVPARWVPEGDIRAGFGRISRPSPSATDSCLNFRTGYHNFSLIPYPSGWFEYRVSYCVLAERLVVCEDTPNPISVNVDPSDELQLDSQNTSPIARVSSWKLWWTRSRRGRDSSPALLRNWSEPAPQSKKTLQCKAVFAICASERPSVVKFANWGPFFEEIELEGPPGIVAFVVWPELTEEFWGHRWVRNEHFKAALRWTQEQLKELRLAMSQHFHQIAEGLRLHFVPRSYRKEVVHKVRGLWTD